MRPLPSRFRARDGFLLMEAILGITLFVIFVSAVAAAFLVAQDGTLGAGDTSRAVFLTEQALEATATIRDQSFSSLTAGPHGLAKQAGRWTFAGTATSASGGYRTSITLTAMDDDTVRAEAVTVWPNRRGGTGTITLTQDFTNWQTVAGGAGECVSLSSRGAWTDAGTPLFNRAVRRGDTLFATSETSAGGAGLYLFDISNEAAPARLASGFNLGAAGREMALYGNVLIVLTDDPGNELRAYDVGDPVGFSDDDLLASIDLPGDGRGFSLLLQPIGPSLETDLLVGLDEDAAEDQLLAYAITPTTDQNGAVTAIAFTIEGSLHDDGGGVTGMATVTPQLIYAADTMNTSELRAFDLADHDDGVISMNIATGTGANATDIQDGLSIAAAGTGALLGRANGEAIEELVLYGLSLTGAPSDGPWVHETGGGVLGLAIDLPGTCAFAATENPTKELIMFSPAALAAGDDPERAIYDAATGNGRGVYYDVTQNRVYLLTNQAIHIFEPA